MAYSCLYARPTCTPSPHSNGVCQLIRTAGLPLLHAPQCKPQQSSTVGEGAAAGEPSRASALDAVALAAKYPHLLRNKPCAVCVARDASGESGVVCFHGESWWAHPIGSYVIQKHKTATITSTGTMRGDSYSAQVRPRACARIQRQFSLSPERMLARPQILVAREGTRQRIAYVSGLPSPTAPLATSGTATFSWDDTAERKGPPTLGAPTQAQAETMGHAAVDALAAVAAMPESEEDMDGGTAVVPVSEVNAGFDTSPEGHMAVLCACETSRVEYPSLGYAMKLENTWPVPVASSSEPLGSSTAPGVAPPCLPGNPTSRFVRALACRYESVPVAGHALNMGFKGSSEVLLAPPTLVAVRRREVRDDGAFMFEHQRLECIATRNTTFQAASNDIVYEPRGYTCAPDEIS